MSIRILILAVSVTESSVGGVTDSIEIVYTVVEENPGKTKTAKRAKRVREQQKTLGNAKSNARHCGWRFKEQKGRIRHNGWK